MDIVCNNIYDSFVFYVFLHIETSLVNFSKTPFQIFFENFATVKTTMPSPRSRRCISEIISGGKLSALCKMGMSSFRCYGNSDSGEM